jgi:hypothetical protein
MPRSLPATESALEMRCRAIAPAVVPTPQSLTRFYRLTVHKSAPAVRIHLAPPRSLRFVAFSGDDRKKRACGGDASAPPAPIWPSLLGAVNLRMSISSFRVCLSSLAVFVAVLSLCSAAARADAAQAPGTESSAGGVTDAWLVARGLIGRGMVGEQSARDAMTPPPASKSTKPGRPKTARASS